MFEYCAAHKASIGEENNHKLSHKYLIPLKTLRALGQVFSLLKVKCVMQLSSL